MLPTSQSPVPIHARDDVSILKQGTVKGASRVGNDGVRVGRAQLPAPLLALNKIKSEALLSTLWHFK